MTPRLSHREAVDLQRRYVAAKHLPDDLMRLVLAELATLTAEREQARKLLGQLREPWAAMKAAGVELIDWARDEDDPPGAPAPGPATGRASTGRPR